jgi:hypothetical protein
MRVQLARAHARQKAKIFFTAGQKLAFHHDFVK